jgi:hypothetical protein
MCADALEDVTQIFEKIDSKSLARGRDAGQDGCRPPTLIASQEGPVLSSHREATQAAVGSVVVDFQIAVFTVSEEGFAVR